MSVWPACDPFTIAVWNQGNENHCIQVDDERYLLRNHTCLLLIINEKTNKVSIGNITLKKHQIYVIEADSVTPEPRGELSYSSEQLQSASLKGAMGNQISHHADSHKWLGTVAISSLTKGQIQYSEECNVYYDPTAPTPPSEMLVIDIKTHAE